MEKLLEQFGNLVMNDSTSLPSKSLENIDSDIQPIIFCINPGDYHPKVGDKVTYDVVQGNNGQLYAINITIVGHEYTNKPLPLDS
ncbi:hypothetical protein [Pseudomonas sp. GR 6-02]|uniref:hypothetical protein n=1 Tax=Pseudomonas sp. GR 6-02 TaxID=1659194 RepID=UPI001F3DD90A|nr:hypothetical protein [Pseudomonas sp. GR 6-02]